MLLWLDSWGGIILLLWMFFWMAYGDRALDANKEKKAAISMGAILLGAFLGPRAVFRGSLAPVVQDNYTARARIGGWDPILNMQDWAVKDRIMSGGAHGWESPMVFWMVIICIFAIALTILTLWICARR